eukprot:1436275-Pyramimonas_sp.AAC.1
MSASESSGSSILIDRALPKVVDSNLVHGIVGHHAPRYSRVLSGSQLIGTKPPAVIRAVLARDNLAQEQVDFAQASRDS